MFATLSFATLDTLGFQDISTPGGCLGFGQIMLVPARFRCQKMSRCIKSSEKVVMKQEKHTFGLGGILLGDNLSVLRRTSENLGRPTAWNFCFVPV